MLHFSFAEDSSKNLFILRLLIIIVTVITLQFLFSMFFLNRKPADTARQTGQNILENGVKRSNRRMRPNYAYSSK